MAIELVVPTVGESITEVQVGTWLKKEGDFVKADEPVLEIESDKATVEVFAPKDGYVKEVVKNTGDTANVGEVVGYFEEGEAPAGGGSKSKESSGSDTGESKGEEAAAASAAAASEEEPRDKPRVMPAAQRLMEEKGIAASDVEGTGPGGRILKEDVMRHGDGQSDGQKAEPKQAPAPTAKGSRDEEVVAMSPMRKRIAEHLVSAQQNAALLTTFNEIDMSGIMALREKYKDAYAKKYDIKLGFMSFFVKASIEALKELPQVNAEIRGTDIVYKHYYDIGIAVGGGKGLVVPIMRNAERLSFAEVELAINDFGQRAQKNKIALEELQGGTFTISNGGVYGSLMSTPILNPPQSAILGMHAIQERPVVRDGEIVIRPMMYVALTYDHRLVDGREAVTFLKRIKECVEEPSRILLEI